MPDAPPPPVARIPWLQPWGVSIVWHLLREWAAFCASARLPTLPTACPAFLQAPRMRQKQPQKPAPRMKPFDRILAGTAGLWGIGAFLFALRDVRDPRNNYPGWVLPFGIV